MIKLGQIRNRKRIPGPRLVASRGLAYQLSARGGRGGIRTHEALADLPVFKTGALNHSATRPHFRIKQLAERGERRKGGLPPDCHPRCSHCEAALKRGDVTKALSELEDAV